MTLSFGYAENGGNPAMLPDSPARIATRSVAGGGADDVSEVVRGRGPKSEAAPSIPQREKEDHFAPVQRIARENTGREVTWEREQHAREETLAEVRRLLRRPITASLAAQIALLNNRELQATFEEIGLAEADLREARTVANPEFFFSARFPDKPPSGTNIEYGVAQSFLQVLMIPLRIRVAKDQLLAAQLRIADEVVKLVAETKSAVFQLQAAEQILQRLKTEKEAQTASLQLIQGLHEAGNITDLQLLQQQAEYSQARLEIALQEAEIRELREKVNRAMGVWGRDTDWKTAPQLPDLPSRELSIRGLETLAVTRRADLAATKAELQSTIKALSLEKTFRWIGALDFGVDSERETDSATVTGPNLRLELPIFNQGQARIKRGEAQLRRAYDRFEAMAINLRSEVRELRDRLIAKRDVAQFYRNDLLPVRRQVREAMLLQYNAMIVGPLELFTVRRQEIETERRALEAVRDYWITRTELERAVGGSLSDGK
jgi:outer membrane protein, heavy metal efflux system